MDLSLHSDRCVDTEPIVALLSVIFDCLESKGIPYCIARNYERYPFCITGDVDIVVAADDLTRAAIATREVAAASGWCCFAEYIGSRTSHSGFFSACYPLRFVLTVEFFAGGGWRGLEFLDPRRMLAGRRWNGTCWIPGPAHEATNTVVHHLLYNGRMFEKYREGCQALASRESGTFAKELQNTFGRRLGAQIARSVSGGKWEELEAMSRAMRRLLLARSVLRHPIRTMQSICRIALDVYRKPLGVIVVLVMLQAESAERVADEIIELATRWHIFLPRRERIVPTSPGRTAREVTAICNGGGVAVVIDSQGTFRKDDTYASVVEIRTAGNALEVSIGGVVVALDLATTGMAPRLWDLILRDRCARKIGRDGA